MSAMRERRGERGSILFDYFIAVSFFMTILGGFFQMTAMKVRAIGEADRRMRAVAAAETRLAEYRVGAAEAGFFSVPGQPDLRGELVLEPREDGLVKATAIVRWREPRGGDQRVALATLAGGS